MDAPLERKPPHLDFHLFMGERQETNRRFSGGRGDRKVSFVERAPGDGTVLASSARMEEPDGPSPIPWTSITPLASSHMGLLKDPRLLRGVLELLG